MLTETKKELSDVQKNKIKLDENNATEEQNVELSNILKEVRYLKYF